MGNENGSTKSWGEGKVKIYRRTSGFPLWFAPVLFLLTAFSATVGPWYVRQLVAAIEIRVHLASLGKSGLPIDRESLLKMLDQRTSREATTLWEDVYTPVIMLNGALYSSGLKTYEDPHQGGGGMTDRSEFKIPPPGEPWPEQRYFVELSKSAEPVLARLRQLGMYDQPVWAPGGYTAYSSDFAPIGWANTFSMLPAMEFEIAFYNEQMDDALEALQLNSALQDKLDWQTTILGETQRSKFICQRNERLLETLEYNLWNQQQIGSLLELVGMNTDLATRWKNVIATERVFALEAIHADSIGIYGRVLSSEAQSDGTYKFIDVAATRLRDFINVLDSGLIVCDGGFNGLELRAGELRKVFVNWPSADGNLFLRRSHRIWNTELQQKCPSFETLATALVNLENSRRITRTALAVKQFQLESGDWPANLDALSIPPAECVTVEGTEFELAVDSNGESATLTADLNVTKIL